MARLRIEDRRDGHWVPVPPSVARGPYGDNPLGRLAAVARVNVLAQLVEDSDWRVVSDGTGVTVFQQVKRSGS